MVCVCLIVGTAYDFYLDYEKKNKVGAFEHARHVKLDMTMPDRKSKSLYVVNNNNNVTIEENLETSKPAINLRKKNIRYIIGKN